MSYRRYKKKHPHKKPLRVAQREQAKRQRIQTARMLYIKKRA